VHLLEIDSPFLVPFDGEFRIADAASSPPEDIRRKKCEKRLEASVKSIREMQRILYAHDHHSVLLVFQAMDAAGKDSTIRSVMTGVNPAGCRVVSFKKPSTNELDHDFLWRSARVLPERGQIGIFNRSYYEEVLVVRVHPEYLGGQNIPDVSSSEVSEEFWEERMESIRDHEKHLARNGTLILKFFLHVSRDEQKNRFLRRIDRPDKNWKFNAGDLEERKLWPAYMAAYEAALNETSRPWAPWFAIPADKKPYMRMTVAEILVEALAGLDLQYPKLDEKERARLVDIRNLLAEEEE
jgi:PPK2 family polyphosphate:nucleotide phosphotransferase